jgi:hypothetical protein
MVGLPCPVSQCAKLHVAGWMWAVFILVYLGSCTWPVAIFTMDQRKEQPVCIKICANLGKIVTETLTMIQQAFGCQLLESYAVVSMACPVQDRSLITWRWWTHRETHKLHNFWDCCTKSKSSSVRINIGPFTLLRGWELVMGHSNRFWQWYPKYCGPVPPSIQQ